ncbi:WXG100 family type VII secretion target [Paenibacillus sp. ISL-20]|uniref:WXG100 family type VII secretion target n=1 Tax=Paenibacillus sp. ISL-20 TaxID=2819163 RepID=UPI001BE92CFE|nr:WXG100 family type VII secretion target [Paenibacillus sp. ISL-20]MBT2765373.1 WXG100 family type VII secretion target [Paenibacillus sp. ISL-20]
MSKILVPPEVLLAVSDQFDRASDQLEANKNTLNQQIQMLASCWDGTTCSRFYYDFQQAYRDMKLTIEHMQVTSLELKRIAYKFMQVDNEQGQLDPRCTAPQILNPAGTSNVHYGKAIEVKSFGDQLKDLGDEAKDFAKGAKSGAAEMWGAVEDKTNALVEDPIGTGKQMAYDVTIGTAEEVVNSTIWGAKMVFDVGDTREKFGERIQAEQERMNEMGKSAYLGQQGAMALGAFALNRIGIKNIPNLMHDSGGDGGKGQGVEKTPKANGNYSGNLVKVPKEDKAADMLAKKLGGESRVKFSNDPNGREFDAISDQYIAQTKPPLNSLDKQFRKQAKATIEAAIETGRKAYFHFEGKPDDRVIRQLQEYAERYEVEIIIDTKTLKP